jgi:hypothetical protein
MPKEKKKKIIKIKKWTMMIKTFDDNSQTLIRKNTGFTFLELLGLLKHAEHELFEQAAGILRPKIVGKGRKIQDA